MQTTDVILFMYVYMYTIYYYDNFRRFRYNLCNYKTIRLIKLINWTNTLLIVESGHCSLRSGLLTLKESWTFHHHPPPPWSGSLHSQFTIEYLVWRNVLKTLPVYSVSNTVFISIYFLKLEFFLYFLSINILSFIVSFKFRSKVTHI